MVRNEFYPNEKPRIYAVFRLPRRLLAPRNDDIIVAQ